MEAKIINIGNSRGLRIPKKVLTKYDIGDHVELDLVEEGIMIRPKKHPREGWAEAAREMHANGDDELLIPDLFDDEDLSWWT